MEYPSAYEDRSAQGLDNRRMCMAFPMLVIAVDGLTARCEVRGAERFVSLWALVDDLPAVGDHLMVHLDRAVQRLSAEEAAAAWATLDEIQAVLDGSVGSPAA